MKLFIVYLMLALASSVTVSSFAMTSPAELERPQNSGGGNKGRNLYRKKRRNRMKRKKGTSKNNNNNNNMQNENARLRREVNTLVSVLQTMGYRGVRGSNSGTTISFDDSPFVY